MNVLAAVSAASLVDVTRSVTLDGAPLLSLLLSSAALYIYLQNMLMARSCTEVFVFVALVSIDVVVSVTTRSCTEMFAIVAFLSIDFVVSVIKVIEYDDQEVDGHLEVVDVNGFDVYPPINFEMPMLMIVAISLPLL